MMRKNKILFGLVLICSIVVAFLIVNNSNSTIKRELKDFAVSDTASIQRLFLADKSGKQVTLIRKDDGSWILSDSSKVRTDLIKQLLIAVKDLKVIAPVSKAAHNNVVSKMAAKSVKIEIYTHSYRINLFDKIKLFPYIKKEKVYYVGGPTQDHLGTYMLIENSNRPFITYIPGFNGYISTRYTADPLEWKTKSIMSYYFHEVQEVEVIYSKEKEKSFKIVKEADKQYRVDPVYAEAVSFPLDTVKVLEYITGFFNLNFEEFVGEQLTVKEKDSVVKQQPYIQVKVKDTHGKSNIVKAYLKENPSKDNPNSEYQDSEYDVDRLYALIHDDKDFVLIQYFVFDKIFKDYNYFFVRPTKLK